jgi:hypothetical protein
VATPTDSSVAFRGFGAMFYFLLDTVDNDLV